MGSRPMDYFSKTIEKGFRILSLFDEDHPLWSQKNISDTVRINSTSTYRLINTFTELGYLAKDPGTKLISVGPMAVAMAHRLLRGNDLRQSIALLVDKIHKKSNLGIDVATYVADTIVVIYRREAENTLSFYKPIKSDELYCTALGKAVLANLSDTDQKEAIKRQALKIRTENTIKSKSELLAELRTVKEKGYSVNNEEYIRGLIAIGAPIFTPGTRRVLGAVSFDSTTVVHPAMSEFVATYAPVIRELGRRISETMPIP